MKGLYKSLVFALVFMAITFGTFKALAENHEGQSSIGVQGGQVNLSGDVGTQYGGALGFGIYYQYFTSPKLLFELGYLYSKHTGTANGQTLNMTQYDFSASMAYLFDDFYSFFPYVKGGVDFVLHAPQDIPGIGSNANYSSLNGFGLNFGLGSEYEIASSTVIGLDLTYHSIFDVAAQAPGSPNAKAIQSFTSLMARICFRFGK